MHQQAVYVSLSEIFQRAVERLAEVNGIGGMDGRSFEAWGFGDNPEIVARRQKLAQNDFAIAVHSRRVQHLDAVIRGKPQDVIDLRWRSSAPQGGHPIIHSELDRAEAKLHCA